MGVLKIDPASRRIIMPDEDYLFGITDDAHAERRCFSLPRIVGDGLDLSACVVRVNYKNAAGEADAYLVEDLTVDGDTVTFSWLFSHKVTKYKGAVRFVVCACAEDGTVEWHTAMGNGMVREGIEVDGAEIEEAASDVIAQLLAVVDAQVSAVEDAAVAATKAAEAEIEAKGANTLASIPEDYTALSDAVAMAAPGIVCEVEGEVITVHDASDRPLAGLRVFGTSEGTAPVVTVYDSAVQLITYPYIDGAEKENNGIKYNVLSDGGIHAVGTAEANSSFNLCDADFGSILINSMSGATHYNLVCTGIDCAYSPVTKKAYLYVTKGETIDKVYYPIVVKGSYTKDTMPPFELCRTQQCAIPYALHEQDEIDLARGVYVKRVDGETVETPLPETVIADFRALHSNKPTTVIRNDAGAWMAVEYVADTKLYIDNALAALR